VALRLALRIEMRFKHCLSVERPIDYTPQVQPLIATPQHGSLPSGHATESYIVATILSYLCRVADIRTSEEYDIQLFAHAERISKNRTIAGVHYPCDSTAGCLLGVTLGKYLLSRADKDFEAFEGRSYLGSKIPESQFGKDFHGLQSIERDNNNDEIIEHTESINTRSDVLNWMWQAAVQEWKEYGVKP